MSFKGIAKDIKMISKYYYSITDLVWLVKSEVLGF